MARENPLRAALGIDVEFPRAGTAAVRVPPWQANLGDDGRIAPGVVLTLLDVALGHAIASRLPEAGSFATVALQVVIHRRWAPGDLLAQGGADALRQDWRETSAQGKVLQPDGLLIASAQGYFARGLPGHRSLSPWTGDRGLWRNFREFLGYAPGGDAIVAPVEARHLNPDGVMHGGAVAALLDGAMRCGLGREGLDDVRLASFSVRYLQPARPGALTLTWQVQRRGRRIHFATASAVGGEGGLVAAADATYVGGEDERGSAEPMP